MQKYRKSIFIILGFVATLVLMVDPAFAGDSLFFKSGVISTLEGTLENLPHSDRVGRHSRDSGDKSKSLFIVQFKTAINSEDQRNLKTLGAKVLYYLPEDAFLVEATTTIARTIGVSSLHVKTVLPFLAETKLSSQLNLQNGEAPNGISSVRVHFAPIENLASLQAKLKKVLGLRRKETEFAEGQEDHEPNSNWVIDADHDLLTKLADFYAIDWIEPAPTEAPVPKVVAAAEASDDKILLNLNAFVKAQNIFAPSSELMQGLRLHQRDQSADTLGGALLIDEKKGLAVGEEHIYPLDVHHSGHLRITLVYTDAPLAPFAEIDRVNHLDLKVFDHRGRALSVKKLNSSGSVDLKVSSGNYEIHIKGSALPHAEDGHQPYALVVSAN